MCFQVDAKATFSFRNKKKWIPCVRRFLWNDFEKGWASPVYGNTTSKCKTWKQDNVHRPTIKTIRPEPCDKNSTSGPQSMLCFIGLYAVYGPLKINKKLPTKKTKNGANNIRCWIHPNDILAVGTKSEDGWRAIKSSRMWLGTKPPTEKQLSQKPIIV